MTKNELLKFIHDIAIVPVVKIDDAAKAVSSVTVNRFFIFPVFS